MMQDRLGVGFVGKITPIKPINEQFTLCKCYVMAVGKNRNRSIISKETVNDALPSLFNIPVVGHLFVDENNQLRMGGHDISLEKDENNNYKFKVLTVPYGVVPQQDGVYFEDVEEDDGNVNSYLVADIILWTGRYPELLDAKYDEETFFAQSMEIIPFDVEGEEEFTKINKFQFSALCLLGKSDNIDENVEPCFKEAKVQPYDFSTTEEWNRLFTEFKEQLTKCLTTKVSDKGEEKVEEFTRDVELEIDEIEDFQDDIQDEEKTNVYLTCETKRKKICKALTTLSKREDNIYKEYCLLDFDDENIYVWHNVIENELEVTEDYLRIPYEINNDEVLIKLELSKLVSLVWLTEEEKEKLSLKEEEFKQLQKYKEDRVLDDKNKAFSLIISEFSDLADIEDYKRIVANAMDFENEEDLKEKLFAIRGKYAIKPTKKSVDTIKVQVGFGKEKESELDEFMSRFLKK